MLSGSKANGSIKERQMTQAGGADLQKVHRSLLPELPNFLDNWPEEHLKHMTAELKSLSAFLETLRKLDATS